MRAAGWAWRVDPGELLVAIPCEAPARPSADMGLVELLAWWRHRHEPRPFDWVEECPELEALGRPQLSIVPFRHVPPGAADLDDHNARLAVELQRDARVYVAPALIDGRVYLRPCIVNFRTTDDDVRALVDIACEVGQSLS